MDWKNSTFFDPVWVGDRPIHIIGAGALGSRYATGLVRSKVRSLVLWDDDVVEPHNCHNQEYYPSQVGMKKVDALAQLVTEINPEVRVVCNSRRIVEEKEHLSGIVLLGVDTLRARRIITVSQLIDNEAVSFVGDGRMGATGGRIYGYDPCDEAHARHILSEEHLPKEPEGEAPGVCAATPPVVATADIVAGMALARLGRWLHYEQGCNDPYHHFIYFDFVPAPFFHVEEWDIELDDESGVA